MKDLDLFQMALGLDEKWHVVKSAFNPNEKRLDIYLDFAPGQTFPCPECSGEVKVHDTVEKTWRHLNFFQHEAYLHARVPRVRCPEHGVKLVTVPWARQQSGFTLLFEALILALADQMPVAAIASLVGETDKRIWRIIKHYVERNLERQDLSQVTRVGVDETASKRGHSYVSLFVDMDTRNVIFVTEGKDAATVQAFKDHLVKHGGSSEQIREFSCDMSPAFISGIEEHFPAAHITFDKFHVMKLLNKALDEVRRQEQITEPGLKCSRYIWLKNKGKLSAKQEKRLSSLSMLKLKTARAYQMKMVFQKAFTYEGRLGVYALQKWYDWAIRSRLDPIKQFARTLKEHWDGIVRWFESKLTNGLLEGLNSLVQAAKARARGYRSTENFKLMIYLIVGNMGRLST
jgi:transposase